MFSPPETIVTDRLVLRPPNLSDSEAIYRYASDPDVTRYMDWPRHTDFQDSVKFTKEALRGWVNRPGFTGDSIS